MYFIKTEKVNEQKGRINFIHYFPNMLTNEDKKGGYLVENFNIPQGKEAFYNYETGEVFFEKAELTEEQKTVKQLEKEIKMCNETILTLMSQVAQLTIKAGER